MTIEERIECALDDLEGLILEGHSPADALKLASEPYGVKPEVLEVRAAPAGQFDDYVTRVRDAKARADAKVIVTKAAQLFRRPGFLPRRSNSEERLRLRAVIAEALGREPTDLEMAIGIETEEAARIKRADRNLADILAMQKLQTPRLHTD